MYKQGDCVYITNGWEAVNSQEAFGKILVRRSDHSYNVKTAGLIFVEVLESELRLASVEEIVLNKFEQ